MHIHHTGRLVVRLETHQTEVGRSLNTLAPDPFAAELVWDMDLFYQAALKLADHPRQEARADGMNTPAGSNPNSAFETTDFTDCTD